jgi:hypothetical protein
VGGWVGVGVFRKIEERRGYHTDKKEVCAKVFLRKTNIFLGSERKRLF